MQQLHSERAAALWGYCLRLTGQDRARAEDVVQETMLRAWRTRPAGRVARLGAVLAVHRGAAHRHRPVAHHPGAAASWPSRSPRGRDGRRPTSCSSRLVVRGDRVALRRHRAVLLDPLRASSVAQAARRLGIPEGTVKSRAHYALEA